MTAVDIAVLVVVFALGVLVGLGIADVAWRRAVRPGKHRWPFRRNGGHQ